MIDLDRCYIGDVREVLRAWVGLGVKVNCIVTSPPYWGLRWLGIDIDERNLELQRDRIGRQTALILDAA